MDFLLRKEKSWEKRGKWRDKSVVRSGGGFAFYRAITDIKLEAHRKRTFRHILRSEHVVAFDGCRSIGSA